MCFLDRLRQQYRLGPIVSTFDEGNNTGSITTVCTRSLKTLIITVTVHISDPCLCALCSLAMWHSAPWLCDAICSLAINVWESVVRLEDLITHTRTQIMRTIPLTNETISDSQSGSSEIISFSTDSQSGSSVEISSVSSVLLFGSGYLVN
jgi:hypothetical protein